MPPWPSAGSVYFILIGVGFMAVEIALLQRMSVFLGHPVYSLAVVLFSMILSAGVGSLLSGRLVLDSPRRLALWWAGVSAYLLALPFFLGPLLLRWEGAPLAARAAVAVGAIAPAGILMGWAFPTGIRLVARVDARPTPWFWGINGAAGVLASIGAVATSLAFGISATFLIGGACYALLLPAALHLEARGRTDAQDTPGVVPASRPLFATG